MSKLHLSPYINFQGRAEEARAFYRKVLGDELADQIIAEDGHPDYPPTVGDNMALALRGPDKQRLATLFDELAEGGKVKMPLAKPSWGDGHEVGYLLDKFGINWMVEVQAAA